jgi:hypothetical protein
LWQSKALRHQSRTNRNPEAKEDKNLEELWAEHNALTNSKEKRAFYLEHIKPQL